MRETLPCNLKDQCAGSAVVTIEAKLHQQNAECSLMERLENTASRTQRRHAAFRQPSRTREFSQGLGAVVLARGRVRVLCSHLQCKRCAMHDPLRLSTTRFLASRQLQRQLTSCSGPFLMLLTELNQISSGMSFIIQKCVPPSSSTSSSLSLSLALSDKLVRPIFLTISNQSIILTCDRDNRNAQLKGHRSPLISFSSTTCSMEHGTQSQTGFTERLLKTQYRHDIFHRFLGKMHKEEWITQCISL